MLRYSITLELNNFYLNKITKVIEQINIQKVHVLNQTLTDLGKMHCLVYLQQRIQILPSQHSQMFIQQKHELFCKMNR